MDMCTLTRWMMLVPACLATLVVVRAQQPDGLKPSFQVTSTEYKEFAFLNQRNAASERDCGGQNLSPAIAWSGEPKETTSFAVSYFDPDGNNGQGEAHWIGYNIAPTVHSLAEGAMSASTPGVTVGMDDHGKQEYYGACPPYGKFHHYVYGVYALDIPVGDLKPGMTRDDLLKAIKGHTRAYQSIVFVYQRKPPAGGVPAQNGPWPGNGSAVTKPQ
jgi:hypothetical protein